MVQTHRLCSSSGFFVYTNFISSEGATAIPSPATSSDSPPPACFATEAAEYPVRRVATNRVIDLLHITHKPQRIARYRCEMLAGARFPPVSVIRIGNRFIIADGHARFQAYRRLSMTNIPVEVWSVRRCLLDQRQQLLRQSRRQWDLLKRSPRDAEARRQLAALAQTTLRHWRRVVLSLFSLARRP